MELLENLQVTQSNQSQLIKENLFKVSEVYLEPIRKFLENFNFCPMNCKKISNVHV